MTKRPGRQLRTLAISLAHFATTFGCFLFWFSSIYSTPPDPYAGCRSAAGCCGMLLLIPFGPLIPIFQGTPSMLLLAVFANSLFWGWMINIVIENWLEARSIRQQFQPESLNLSESSWRENADTQRESQAD